MLNTLTEELDPGTSISPTGPFPRTPLENTEGHTYPHKACRKPGLFIFIPAPPPVLVRGFQDLDDIPSLEAQFLVIHGHMVPQCFCTDHAAIADELERRWERKLSIRQRGQTRSRVLGALSQGGAPPSTLSGKTRVVW